MILAAGPTSAQSTQSTTEERPRTKPALITGLGTVDFRTESKDASCQRYCNQGAAWLHGGDARQADRAFFAATEADPRCAMAWWGLALANIELGDDNGARRYAKQAVQHGRRASPRVRMWTHALRAYVDDATPILDRRADMVRALDDLASTHPEDHEAKAFLVRQLLENRDSGLPIPIVTAVDAMLSALLRAQPRHPAHRYRMALWEEQPARARTAARAALRELASVPLALIAAGRTLSQLEETDAAIRCFETAYTAMHDQLRGERIAPTQIVGFADNLDLLARHYARVGRVDEALALAEHLIRQPAPKSSDSTSEEDEVAAATPRGHGSHTATLEKGEVSPTSTGQHALLEILIEAGRWRQLRAADAAGFFASTDPRVQARRSYARGHLHANDGNDDGRRQALAKLRKLTREAPPSLTLSEQRDYWRSCRTYIAQLEQLTVTARPRPGRKHGPDLVDASASPTAQGTFPKWQPPKAPTLSLPDRFSQLHSLSQLRGKAVVVVFYLGSDCAHCIEQLQSFAPLDAAYRKAGIAVVAVSPDSVAGLQKTFGATGSEDAAPFQLVSDAAHDTFRAFGAFDTRTKSPLHGTFLIDRQGFILWQNISVAPFMATKELLAEAKRVLALPRCRPTPNWPTPNRPTPPITPAQTPKNTRPTK